MRVSSQTKNLVVSSILVFSVAILILLLINPNLINRKTPGSFEYVRKGTALLEKGRHLDAIKYFEKGYESSPDSEAIRDNLIYAYSKYAESMAQDGKYDAAIQYLIKAYDIVQNHYTKQNLAIIYAKRALSETKKMEWKKAEEDLEYAYQAASDSTNAERGLGITLFNDAVGEFKVGREDSAILLLKAAIIVYPDSRIYEFLGDIYYKKNDLQKAQFSFDKAMKSDPANASAAEKYGKVIESEKTASSEESKSSPSFDVKYGEGLTENADRAAAVLEEAYHKVGKELSYFPKAKTTVFFYSEKDFRRIFKMPSMIRAFYDGNIRVPFPEFSKDEDEFKSYLYHEYTHAVVSAKTNNNCPVWLSEGIAVYEELKWTRPGVPINLADKIEGQPNISLKSLDDAFKTEYHNDPELVTTYLLAYTAVEYIVDTWGMEGLKALLKRIAEGQHVVNAIDDEFLLSEKAFQSRWMNFVMKKYVKQREGK